MDSHPASAALFDAASVRELAGMWQDGKASIVRAREIIRSGEQMILSEAEQGRRTELDAAWDVTGLIDEYRKERG